MSFFPGVDVCWMFWVACLASSTWPIKHGIELLGFQLDTSCWGMESHPHVVPPGCFGFKPELVQSVKAGHECSSAGCVTRCRYSVLAVATFQPAFMRSSYIQDPSQIMSMQRCRNTSKKCWWPYEKLWSHGDWFQLVQVQVSNNLLPTWSLRKL